MSFDAIDHVQQTWKHVVNGDSTTAEKIECAAESLGVIAAVGTIGTIGLTLAARAESALPELSLVNDAKLSLFPLIENGTGREIVASHEFVPVDLPVLGHEGLSKRWVLERLTPRHVEVSTQYLRPGEIGGPVFHSCPKLFENTLKGRLNALVHFQDAEWRLPGT